MMYMGKQKGKASYPALHIIVLAVGLLCLLTGRAESTVIFQTAVPYGTGTTPNAVVTGDFNGDGALDLAVANGGGNNISILLGNGDGAYQAAVNYGTGTNPYALIAGDFNGDGKTDLAVANSGSANISVLLGNGDGSFQAAVNYGTGTSPSSVTSGDFNGDGKTDLAAANSGSANISVLLGNGDGSFQAAVNYSAGTNPSSVTSGDFNGDGKLDLAVANYTSNNVSILAGNGSGGFQAAVNYGAGTSPRSVTTGDFNGDGKPDLAVANANSSNVSVLLADASGGFQPAVNYDVTWVADCVIAGDFNGDGALDLAVENQAISILLGNGNGTFQAALDFKAGSGGAGNLVAVASGDFNGDGVLDFAAPYQYSNNVAVFLGDRTFAPAVNYSAGSAPISVALGDFNGDGRQDFALANGGGSGNTVSVLLGNGNGTFPAAGNYSAGAGVSSVIAGDFNGDGRTDLATANSMSNNVSILLGNGDGTFQAAINYSVGADPRSLAAGDFNGDGRLDLAVAKYNVNTVSILIGNGDGGFQTAVAYSAGTNPYFVTTGDFDGDGRLDLAVVNMGSDNLSILSGYGNGAFQAAVNYATGSSPISAATGDFNGDGKLDIAVANMYGNTVSIFLRGAGAFQAAVDYTVGMYPKSVTAGDFNGDGKLDVAVTNYNDNNISLLMGNGTGAFQSPANYGVGTKPQFVAQGDVNGDRRSDLIVANQTGNSISILLANGGGKFLESVNYGVARYPSAVTARDFNGDGKADLAVMNGNDNNVSILLGNGAGVFQAAVNYGAGTAPSAAVAGDFNRDGKPDLAVANYGGNNVSILLGSGNGAFPAAVNYSAGKNPSSVTAGDFNGDGKLDLATANYGANNVSVLLGNGDGTFLAAVLYSAGRTPKSVTAADFNGDGTPDLAVANYGGGNVSVLLGNGTGTFRAAVNYSAGTQPSCVTAGDFNGDGKPDLAVANTGGNTVSVLLGNGDGTFRAADNYNAGTGPISLAAGDFNRDGKLDLAVVNTGGNDLSLLPGNGNGSFQAAVKYGTGTTPCAVTAGDFSGDGRPDLAVANYGNGNVSVLLYTTDVTPPATTAAASGYSFGSWTTAGSVIVALSVNDGAGTGTASGYPHYCVDTTDTCTPGSSYSSAFDVTCGAGSTCTQYLRYQSADNAGNSEAVQSRAIKQDLQAPVLTISAPSSSLTRTAPVAFAVDYSDINLSAVTLTGADVTLTTSGTATGSVSVTGSGASRTVTISGIAGDGALGITLAPGTASDTLGHIASGAGSATFTVDNTRPNPPIVAGISPTNSSWPEWSWTTGGGGMFKYRIKLDKGTWMSGNFKQPYASPSPLAAGSHTLYVQERDEAGNWSASGSFTIVIDPGLMIPTAPANLRGSFAGGWVTLSWDDMANNELGYRIYRRLSTESGWILVHDVGPNSTGCSDPAPGELTWYYLVRPWNGAGSSPGTSVKIVTGDLIAPDQLKTAATGTAVNVTWRDNTTLEEGYDVFRRQLGESVWSKITTTASLAVDATAYSDASAITGILYSYQVCATTSAGGQACSGAVGVNGPNELLASYETGTGVTLSWTVNSIDETGFRIYRKTSTETMYAKIGEAGAGGAEYIDATAAEDTTYQYHVNAYNTAAGASSEIVSITTGTLLAPAWVTAEAVDSQVTITWRDRANNEDGYEVWRRSAGAPDWTSIAALPANSTSTTDTTTSPGILYRYQVCAVTAAGGQGCGGAVGVNGPADFTADYSAGAGVVLTWTDSSSDETGFRIMRKENSGTTWIRLHDAAADAITWTDEAAAPGDYSYKVCAVNAVVTNCGAVKTVTVP